MDKKATASTSFEEAFAFTQSLMAQMLANQLTEAEIEEAIASLVQSQNGARGFFVTYLTDDSNLADNPSTGVISALESSPGIVSELMVKNIAMSTAMAITHNRHNDPEMVASSQRVSQRSADVIKKMQPLDILTEELKKLKLSVNTGEGSYQEFLEKWGYDQEQKEAIAQIIAEFC